MLKNDFKKEYTILCIYGRGQPFYLRDYKTLEAAKAALYEIIQNEEKYNRVYYVDNDFYENKYQIGLQAQKYFCIQEREVSEWKKSYSQNINKHCTNNNNIIMFKKWGTG